MQQLTKTVQKAMDEHIPKKSKRSRQFPFWFSKELRSALCRKRRLHKLMKATNDTSARTSFKEQRSLAKVLLARDKKHFSDFTESSLTHSPGDFWRNVKARTRKALSGLLCRMATASFPTQSAYANYSRNISHLRIPCPVIAAPPWFHAARRRHTHAQNNC